jgi:hypothetical protein
VLLLRCLTGDAKLATKALQNTGFKQVGGCLVRPAAGVAAAPGAAAGAAVQLRAGEQMTVVELAGEVGAREE